MDLSTERIRALNDELRRNLPTGHAVMTPASLPSGPKPSPIVKTIAVYDDFCHANDPYQEHDWLVRSRRPHDLFQNRLLRQGIDRSLARPVRSVGHRARHHHHAGRGVLTALQEDMMADEAPVNRQRRSPVSALLTFGSVWSEQTPLALLSTAFELIYRLASVARAG